MIKNGIKYSQTKINNALNRSNIAIGINDVDYGPTNQTGFWNGVDIPTNGYVIYTYVGGKLNSYGAKNDLELIDVANKILGANYSNVNDIFTVINTKDNIIIMNKYYEDIVTDGLLINLDTSLPSFSGNDSKWYDLSGNNNHANVMNAPTLTSNYLGSMSFDGVSDYLSIPYNSSFDFSKQQTISFVIRPGANSRSARRNFYNQAYGGSGTITHETSGVFSYYCGTHGGNGSPYIGVGSSFTVEPNEFAHVCLVRSQISNSVKWYKNGVYSNGSSAGGYSSTNNGSSEILIGRGYTSMYVGEIYNASIYNKALSDDEVMQNYKAINSRFI